MTKEELQAWLESVGIYPPSDSGYGQVTSDDLAERLLQAFTIAPKYNQSAWDGS